MDSTVSPSTKPIYRGTQVVWYILGIIEVILGFRFLLKLLGANTAADFTQFIYAISHPFVAPFLSVFRTSRVEGSTIEWSTVLAFVVYWVIAILVIRLFLMGRSVSTPEAAYKLERQDEIS